MFLKRLTVRNWGSVELFLHDFGEGLNVLRVRYDGELIGVIRLILCHRAPPMPLPRADAAVEAEVCVNGAAYLVRLTAEVGCREPIRRAYDRGGAEVTAAYEELCTHCVEHDLADVFEEGEGTVLRLVQYADEDRYYAPQELAARTEGASRLGTFRAYLRRFLRDFKGETIREGKRYEVVLRRDGGYAVRYRTDGGRPTVLSASEHTLVRYLCFLQTAEFWRGFEEIRNLHGIRKPLLIKDFPNHTDASIDTAPLLHRAAELGRQVIVVSRTDEGGIGTPRGEAI